MAHEESLKPFRISEIIKAEITDLDPHTSIPTERQMAERFGVSRVSIQKALSILVENGIVYRRHGAGTFVAPPRNTQQLQLLSFSEEMELRGMRPATTVLDVSVVKNTEIYEMDSPAYRIERLRFGDQDPVAWEVSFISCAIAPGLEKADLTGSLYSLLEREYRQEVSSIDEHIIPFVADKEVSERLSVPVGSATLKVNRNGFNSRGEVIELSHSVRRGDKWELRYSLHK